MTIEHAVTNYTMSHLIDLIATTAFGLEAIVRRELKALGYEATICSPGRLRFQADISAISRCNLWLRTADRILIELASFLATDFDTLFETAQTIAWNEWLPNDANIRVVGRSLRSQLSSVPACQRTVKKAIVEQLLKSHHVTALPETGIQFKVEIAILNDQATLSIDTTGPSLHKRGFRQAVSKAPLKETLAAALVLLSFWKKERPLIDPFCGSGTIPIEAALIGRNLAPGLQRAFDAEAWPNIPSSIWSAAREEAHDLTQPAFEERLIGTDSNGRVLQSARDNAARAGVSELVHFQQKAFDELSSQKRHGCVIANPPYGQRLGEEEDLVPLYESVPLVLRKLPTWSHYILTAMPNFETIIGRQADRRRKLYNGRIECTYFQFHGPRPSTRGLQGTSPTAPANEPTADPSREKLSISTSAPPTQSLPPVFGGVNPKSHEQAELLQRRLRKRAKHLRRWPTQRGISCFRLYERDIPEIPWVVDRYEDHLHITEYERPHERDIGQHADWVDLLKRAAAASLDIDPQNVFFKRRQRQRGTSQHAHLAKASYEIIVQEGGLQFIVNLSDYIDTGLFLDHRITRKMVQDLADQKTFLNLFGYTGSFSVYAAHGGAAQTTTVDSSQTYLTWAQRNMRQNGFTGQHHGFIQSDAQAFVAALPPVETYDLVVVDPPTFSNTKNTTAVWDIQKDYAALINRLIPCMKPAGIIFFSTNFRRFQFDSNRIHANTVHEISRQTVPDDFRNRRIHRCWKIQKNAISETDPSSAD